MFIRSILGAGLLISGFLHAGERRREADVYFSSLKATSSVLRHVASLECESLNMQGQRGMGPRSLSAPERLLHWCQNCHESIRHCGGFCEYAEDAAIGQISISERERQLHWCQDCGESIRHCGGVCDGDEKSPE